MYVCLCAYVCVCVCVYVNPISITVSLYVSGFSELLYLLDYGRLALIPSRKTGIDLTRSNSIIEIGYNDDQYTLISIPDVADAAKCSHNSHSFSSPNKCPHNVVFMK